MRGLLNENQKIEILVLRKHLLENHIDIEPILLPKSVFMFSRIKKFEGLKFRAWDLPSLRNINKKILRNDSQTIIVRLEKSMFSIVILCIALVKLKKEVVVYHQRSIPEDSYILRLIQALLFKFMKWKCISPVKKDSYQGPLEYECWIPFATSVSSRITTISNQQNRLSIVTIGKLVDRKNINLVIEIFQKLNSSIFELCIIAENTTMEHSRTKSKLKDIIEVKSKITFMENIDHQRVRSKLEQSHIFLLLSQNEPASVSNLEAMASGNLIIVGRDNGTANYIQDKKGGYIVNYKEDEVIEILRLIEERPDMVAEMGRVNLNDVKKNFENSVVSKLLIKFIEQ